MKELKNEILEILLDKIKCSGYTAIEGIPQSAREIESLIKENYVEKEFVKWIIIEFLAGRITYYDSDNTYSIWNIDIDYTLDELYDYWLINVKSKQEIK